ncbi:carbonic anhydrase [Pyrobaculum sp.]|uniref:carbonic anhydrase n=1 Tax=Pyrobaculum sp. TaxID=2004705 RepID=UPI00316E8B05
MACWARDAVTDAVLDSLSFAEKSLGVREIYVIGHKRCGAVALAAQGKAPPSLAPQLEEAPRRTKVENVCISCEEQHPLGAELECYYYDMDVPALRRACT